MAQFCHGDERSTSDRIDKGVVMSGGHWSYFDADFKFELDEFVKDPIVVKRFPELARVIDIVGGRLCKILHDIDWDVEGDSEIEDDKRFEAEAVALLGSPMVGTREVIDALYANACDEQRNLDAQIDDPGGRSGRDVLKVAEEAMRLLDGCFFDDARASASTVTMLETAIYGSAAVWGAWLHAVFQFCASPDNAQKKRTQVRYDTKCGKAWESLSDDIKDGAVLDDGTVDYGDHVTDLVNKTIKLKDAKSLKEEKKR